MERNSTEKTVQGQENAIESDITAIEMDDASSLLSAPIELSKLPPEILISCIGSYLGDKSKAQLSQTSKKLHGFFQDDLKKSAVENLYTYILCGEEKKALDMIAICPERLLLREKSVDYSGRIFKNVTPFQAAILSHDVTLWKKMEPFFDKLPYGQANKKRQFQEIFPEGLPEQKPYNFSALLECIHLSAEDKVQTLLDNPLDTKSTLGQALENFRKDFTRLAMEEKFFNPTHLIEVFNIYAQQCITKNWSSKQLCLFWNQVIGYTQRFLPACYAQAFCQGLYCVANDKQALTRSLACEDSQHLYFPLEDSSGLGFDFGIFSVHKAKHLDTLAMAQQNTAVFNGGPLFIELCKGKTSELSELEQRINHFEQSIADCNTKPLRSYCTIS